MALTPEGTPYVESTDLVANYPAASLSLANRVDLVGVLPFADSAARSAAITSPTDGQFTYLQDTNTPEFYNGSSYVPVGTDPGLTLITSQSPSAAATVSIDNCFSATYDAYRIIFFGVASTAQDLYYRLRVGGADNSTASSYVTQNVQGNSTTASASLLTSDKGLIGFQNTNMTQFSGDIFRPALAVPTFLNSVAGRDPSQYSLINSSYHNQSTAYDGITIIAGAGNLTGTLKIYGYRN